MRTNYTFGLKPDKRENILDDYVLTTSITKEIVVADRLNFRSEMTPVQSQGTEGSCGGEAGNGVEEFLQQRDYKKFIPLSIRWLYNLARDRGGYKEGCTLSDVSWVAYNKGVPEAKYWEYIPGDKTSQPISIIDGETVDDNAYRYRIKSYARIPDLNRLLIAMNDPLIKVILVGFKVYKGIISEQCKKDGIVPDPICFESSIGGHAMVLEAYDKIEKLSQYKKAGWVETKNSWGIKYGDKGYNKFSIAYIKNMTSAYAWTDIPHEELKKKTVRVSDISRFDIMKEKLWIPKV